MEGAIRAAAELGVPERAAAGRARHLAALPPRRSLPRRGDRPARAARPRAAPRALDAGVELHERSRVDVDPRPARSPPPAAVIRAPEIVVATNAWTDRLAPGARPADAVRQLRRPHRAGAGAARGDRLDGRRGDRRRPDVPPLLPDDRRRAGADGLRLGADRPRRPGSTRASSTTRRPSPAPSRGSAACCPGSPPRRSSGRGAARSTSPATSCRSSRTVPGTRIHFGAGYCGQRRRPELARRADPRLARPRRRRRVVAPAARAAAAAAAAARSRSATSAVPPCAGRSCRSRRADEAGRRAVAARPRRRRAAARCSACGSGRAECRSTRSRSRSAPPPARALERPPRPHPRPAGGDSGGVLHGGRDLGAGRRRPLARRGGRLEVDRRERRVRARLRPPALRGVRARAAVGLLPDRPRAGARARAARRRARPRSHDVGRPGGRRLRRRRGHPARAGPPARPGRDALRRSRSRRRSPATR